MENSQSRSSRFRPALVLVAGAWIALVGGCGQPAEPGKAVIAAATSQAAPPPATQPVTVDDRVREPATVDEAARLLDLQTFPQLEGAKLYSRARLGSLLYEAKADLKEAMAFQRKQLTERGWQELPDSRIGPAEAMSHFTTEGYVVSVSVSTMSDKPGTVMVSLANHGNIRPGKLPVAAGLKSEYQEPYICGYVTTKSIADTAAACRKLLLEQGWQPYGENSYDQKVSADRSMDFKRNAIKLHVSVSTHENRPGDTMIRYTTQMLAADLPLPPTGVALDTVRYSDGTKTLTFDTTAKVDDVAAFYRDTLAKQEWKPTTEPKGAIELLMVFYNPRKDSITLDVKGRAAVTKVSVRHHTAAELAELDRLFKEEMEKRKKGREQP
jgi:hypothetical protein